MVASPASSLKPPPLLELLADGRLHSGARLADALGLSRAMVEKGIMRLRQLGIAVESVRGRGYALPAAVELLQEAAVRAAVAAHHSARLAKLELKFDVDSTNSRLLASPPPPCGQGAVLITELQHAGRGRRGRHWSAPFGSGIALSMGWSFADAARAGPALSLCVGVAVVRALTRAGAQGVGLKWPNDLWYRDRKVGGVLIEMRADAGGPAHAVIGVGVNVSLSAAARAGIESGNLKVAAVAEACAAAPSRNFIAGAIIDELLSMLTDVEQAGFAAAREEWLSLDVLRGRPAEVHAGDAVVCGVARGVDARGALLLERAGRLHAFMSGEVSLRLGENVH